METTVKDFILGANATLIKSFQSANTNPIWQSFCDYQRGIKSDLTLMNTGAAPLLSEWIDEVPYGDLSHFKNVIRATKQGVRLRIDADDYIENPEAYSGLFEALGQRVVTAYNKAALAQLNDFTNNGPDGTTWYGNAHIGGADNKFSDTLPTTVDGMAQYVDDAVTKWEIIKDDKGEEGGNAGANPYIIGSRGISRLLRSALGSDIVDGTTNVTKSRGWNFDVLTPVPGNKLFVLNKTTSPAFVLYENIAPKVVLINTSMDSMLTQIDHIDFAVKVKFGVAKGQFSSVLGGTFS